MASSRLGSFVLGSVGGLATAGRAASLQTRVARRGAASLSYQAARRASLASSSVASSSIRSLATSPKIPTNPAQSVADALRLPAFAVPSSSLRLLSTPSEFYDEVLALIASAKQHVFIGSLYIGYGETGLIDALRKALEATPSLHVTILLDYQRSTREGPWAGSNASAASLVASLVRDFGPERITARLFRAPGLPRWAERAVGKRFVEAYGLQHMKVYGADDRVMFSGANLSNDYFSNRQDRYMVIENGSLAAYAHSLLLLVARYSYALRVPAAESAEPPHHHSAYELEWDGGASLAFVESAEGLIIPASAPADAHAQPPSVTPEHGWARRAGQDVHAFTARWQGNAAFTPADSRATTIVPLLQMAKLRVTHETCAAPLLRPCVPAGAQLSLTSGYFGLSAAWADLVLASRARTLILAAAPEANGFFGSKGPSRHLPPAYTWLEQRFWKRLKAQARLDSAQMREWKRQGWTYHAKGIWIAPGEEEPPTTTLIGSSNFGQRSAKRDLECTLIISAPAEGGEKEGLPRALQKELENLTRHADDVVDERLFARPDRKVSLGVKIAAWCVKGLL